MAGVIITASVGGGGTGTVADSLGASLDDEGYELVVVHGPRACGPCRANENPQNVPCAECTGNIEGRSAGGGDDPDGDDDDELRGGNLCQCRVKLRRKHGDHSDGEDLGFIEDL
jgi:hypothetical protein